MTVAGVWFGTLLACVVWWLWSCVRLFKHLRIHHPSLYERMGNPNLFTNNRPVHTIRLFRFLYGRLGTAIDDDWLSNLRNRMRVVGVLYFVGFIGFIIATMTGLIDVPA